MGARRIIRYGFVELLDDVSYWLVLGIVLSAVATIALPAKLFEGVWGGGIASMVLMLILGVPLYTCASSSTPMAAALALKGLSPGAVLVFLLAGPATNIGGLVVLLKVLGRRAVAVYLTVVGAATLAAGFALNAVYQAWGLDPRATFGMAPEFLPDPLKNAGAFVLIALLILSMRRTRIPHEWIWLRDKTIGHTANFIDARSLIARQSPSRVCCGSVAAFSLSALARSGCGCSSARSSRQTLHPGSTSGGRGPSRPTASSPRIRPDASSSGSHPLLPARQQPGSRYAAGFLSGRTRRQRPQHGESGSRARR
jgi:hypothetical protein